MKDREVEQLPDTKGATEVVGAARLRPGWAQRDMWGRHERKRGWLGWDKGERKSWDMRGAPMMSGQNMWRRMRRKKLRTWWSRTWQTPGIQKHYVTFFSCTTESLWASELVICPNSIY